jgi:hypothetical protein
MVSVLPDRATDDPVPFRVHWELETAVACPGVTAPATEVPASLDRLRVFCRAEYVTEHATAIAVEEPNSS